MAISGFGAQNNLSLGLSLNANKKQQSIVKQEETTKQEEVKKEDLQETKIVGKQINFGQVDSLLISKGVKINKPAQPEQPEIKLNEVYDFGCQADFDASRYQGKYKHGDSISIDMGNGRKLCGTVERMDDGKLWFLIDGARGLVIVDN